MSLRHHYQQVHVAARASGTTGPRSKKDDAQRINGLDDVTNEAIYRIAYLR